MPEQLDDARLADLEPRESPPTPVEFDRSPVYRRAKPAAAKKETAPADPADPTPRRCAECGYNLHNLPTAALCPECGHDPGEAALRRAGLVGDAWWARSVAGGLLLLVAAGFVMLGVTVYMDFGQDWGGSAALLNFPGPKLWGTALLQRNIGGAPGPLGVTGTRFGLLCLLGLWLVTAPRDAARFHEGLFSLRRLLRWGSLACFGGMFGLLLGERGIWYGDDARQTYTLLLVSVVELPATTLLYLYLRQLAGDLHDARLRRAFDVLALGTSACVGGAVVLLLLGDTWHATRSDDLRQLILGGYGVLCVTLGVAATASVVRMALTLLPAALGDPAKRHRRGKATPADAAWRRRLLAGLRPERLGRLAAAVGLLGWLAVSAGMFGHVVGLAYRTGFGGNWPMINVVGPKVWAVPMAQATESLQRYRYGDFFGFGVDAGRGGVVLMLACLWLVTVRQGAASDKSLKSGGREDSLSPRRIARWASVGLVSAALGLFVGGVQPSVLDLPTYIRLSAHTLPLTLFVEAPATLAVYLYLASLARGQGDAALGKSLAWAGLLACTLILTGNGLFVLSHLGLRTGGLLGGGLLGRGLLVLYGVAAVGVGLWMAWCVLGLVRLLLCRAFAPEPQRQLTLF